LLARVSGGAGCRREKERERERERDRERERERKRESEILITEILPEATDNCISRNKESARIR